MKQVLLKRRWVDNFDQPDSSPVNRVEQNVPLSAVPSGEGFFYNYEFIV